MVNVATLWRSVHASIIFARSRMVNYWSVRLHNNNGFYCNGSGQSRATTSSVIEYLAPCLQQHTCFNIIFIVFGSNFLYSRQQNNKRAHFEAMNTLNDATPCHLKETTFLFVTTGIESCLLNLSVSPCIIYKQPSSPSPSLAIGTTSFTISLHRGESKWPLSFHHSTDRWHTTVIFGFIIKTKISQRYWLKTLWLVELT